MSTLALKVRDDSSSQPSPLSTGAIIGIGFGACALLLLACVLFYLYWRSQRKYEYRQSMTRSVQSGTLHIAQPSMSPGYYYTRDYKVEPGAEHRRNYQVPNPNEMHIYDHIRTQAFAVPERTHEETQTATGALWGLDTGGITRPHEWPRQPPVPPVKNVTAPLAQLAAPAHDPYSDIRATRGLDVMPTHPAFIPRAFRSGSRNPAALAPEETSTKNPKYVPPDDFAQQQYIDAVHIHAAEREEAEVLSAEASPETRSPAGSFGFLKSPLSLRSIASPKSLKSLTSSKHNRSPREMISRGMTSPKTPKSATSMISAKSNTSAINPFLIPLGATSSTTYELNSLPGAHLPINGPAIPPNLQLKSFSDVRSPKGDIPPPIKTDTSRSKARRLSGPDQEDNPGSLPTQPGSS